MPHQSQRPLLPRRRSRLVLAAAFAALTVTAAACGQPTAQQPVTVSTSSTSSLPDRPQSTVTVPDFETTSGSPTSESESSSPASEPESTTSEPTPESPAADPASSEPVEEPVVEPVAPTTTAAPPPAADPAPPAAPPAAGTGQVAGRVVALDAGHNGANGRNTSIINQPVPDGRGGTKPCNTTGTSTNGGYAEHAFNWSVTNYIKAYLEEQGVQVVMIREDADGIGPCIDVRAERENSSNADLVVSIHADGFDEGERGFYIILAGPQTSVSAPYEAQSAQLATTVRDALVSGGLQVSSWLGENGITYRDDLTGLNLSAKPKILVEYGNMRDSQEAAYMQSKEGQQAYARATTDGILQYLRTH